MSSFSQMLVIVYTETNEESETMNAQIEKSDIEVQWTDEFARREEADISDTTSTSTDGTTSTSTDSRTSTSTYGTTSTSARPQRRPMARPQRRSTIRPQRLPMVESEQDLVATTIKACFVRIPTKKNSNGTWWRQSSRFDSHEFLDIGQKEVNGTWWQPLRPDSWKPVQP
ncbi:hypothetical protein F2Q68_00025580 [Brassica cretica]|uniref:Uncharacterized protein n=1 Tax=Brassica cretica TaxID=69181 RepID=A0A8S9IAJ2_BRACR|nr:hypothetical protein F2Q68_00025580 [Brassica cretica]